MSAVKANPDKIKAVMAYVASAVEPGKLKLFKLMYLADFRAYATLGHSITGDMYQNFQMGPVPKFLWSQFDSLAGQCVTITPVPVGDGLLPEQRMSRKAGFVVSLTDEEKAILDDVLKAYGERSGNDLKKLTHETIPYLATEQDDIIPYGLSAYLDYKRPSGDEVSAFLAKQEVKDGLRSALKEYVPF